MHEKFHAAQAFAQTLWVTRASTTRDAFEAWQSKQLNTWLRKDLPNVGFYSGTSPTLSSLPMIDKSILMSDFEAFNLGKITAEAGWHAIETTGETGGISIGASTGTSGNRSLYAVTIAERFRWLGTILAKTIPRFLFRPERVAILLPQTSALYETANKTGRISFRFFDLTEGLERWLKTLRVFNPTTIVAPPRVLKFLAEHSVSLSPRRIYAGGETLDPMDRAIIEREFGIPLGQIYMASEGLLGVSCGFGSLHLAEDANHFEFECIEGGLVSPIITSFRRRFQILARYRMNDLLRLSTTACPCGSPQRVVDEIVGRLDDVFVFQRSDGTDILMTPDVLRNAVLNVSREITDFRIQRVSYNSLTLVLHPELPQQIAQAVLNTLQRLFLARGLHPDIELSRDVMAFQAGPKLRRIESRFRGEK